MPNTTATEQTPQRRSRRRETVEHWAICSNCNGGGCRDCNGRGEYPTFIPL
ncbi:hypothetical protein [Nocardia testacea]|uniref:hypothetical protein n=1 Tax=Nocardia testacea TaxID=248551 RepID=UPI0002E7071A|nr:hypothetical protein [Nocardia testacea]